MRDCVWCVVASASCTYNIVLYGLGVNSRARSDIVDREPGEALTSRAVIYLTLSSRRRLIMRLGFSEQSKFTNSYKYNPVHQPTTTHPWTPLPATALMPHTVAAPFSQLRGAAPPHPDALDPYCMPFPIASSAASARPKPPSILRGPVRSRPPTRLPGTFRDATRAQWRVVSPRGQSALSGAWSVQSTQWRVVHWPPGAYWL